MEWDRRWIAHPPAGNSEVFGLDAADDFVFHSFSHKPTLLIVRDRESGAVVVQHEVDTRCLGVVASRKGPRALYACNSGEVVLVERGSAGVWSAENVVKLDRLAMHAIWNESETLVAVASNDMHVYLYDAPSFRQAAKLGPFSHVVWRLAFSPNGNLLYAIDWNSEVRVLGLADRASWQEIGIISRKRGFGERGLALSPDGRHLACDIQNVGLCVWKVPAEPLDRESWKDVTPVITFKGYGRAFNVCFAGPDLVIMPDVDQHKLRVFSISGKGALVAELSTENKPRSVTFDAVHRMLFVGHESGAVHALQIKDDGRPAMEPFAEDRAPIVRHMCLRSRKSTISARIASIDGKIETLSTALGVDGLRAHEEIGQLTIAAAGLEADLNATKEKLSVLRLQYGQKIDALGALEDERTALWSERTTIDRSLAEYYSHVSGGAHHVNGRDLGIALCDSGACGVVTQASWDAIDALDASPGWLIGKNAADLALSLAIPYAASASIVAELEGLLALGRDLPTSILQPLPPPTGMLAWKHADVIAFLEAASVDIASAFKAQPTQSAWGGPALAFADALHLIEATHCTIAQANAVVALVAKEKERQIAARQLPSWTSTWTVSTKFSRVIDPEAELAEVIAEMAALELQFGPPPPNIACPITKRAMKDPVLASDEEVYERLALLARFAKGNMTSPVEPTIVLSTTLTASVKAQRNIAKWQEN